VSEANPRGGADLTELVAAAKGGDGEAFEAVVRATYADTYGLALRLTANEEDAKDVVQEAYLRAYRGLKRFRGEASFTTWLYRITANCATTHLGKRARHRHDALAALPPRLRAVVVLRDVYDLPHEAIAAELGISEAAAKVRLHRARLRLRAQLFPTRGERGEEDAHAV
jgi:RNA polymerase sigma-70 factor, ECF subfamily